MDKNQIKNTIKITLILGIAFLAIMAVDGAVFGTNSAEAEEPAVGFYSQTVPYAYADTDDCPGAPGGCH